MKTTIYTAGICLFLLAGNCMPLQATTVKNLQHAANEGEWKKSPNGSWPGMKDGKTYWYRLDKKGGLWWSTDGEKWDAVKDGAWADKAGKWLKIHNKKLVWSADGKTWSEVPQWQWQGSDGKWYKFDNKWGLWVNG